MNGIITCQRHLKTHRITIDKVFKFSHWLR